MRHLLITILVSIHVNSAAQEYVEICDCTKGVQGVCIEYLDSMWQPTSRSAARWYYYNYSFGRYRFFDWSWSKKFVRNNTLIATDSAASAAEAPLPLDGKYYWTEKESQTISVEQTFSNGWPNGQTKAYSKKGYLLECLDFESPYNRGKFSMMCHLYHKGKLDVQCLFAIDMTENRSYALDIPWKVNEPPTALGILPKYQRSLILDIQGLRNEHLSATLTPNLFHLIGESCYAAHSEPMRYASAVDSSHSQTNNFLTLYQQARGWRTNQIYASGDQKNEILSTPTTADVFIDDSEIELLKMCRSSLRENEVRHLLVSIDTLQMALYQFADTSEEVNEALQFVDRFAGQLMQYMRLNVTEMDWNCVLITSSSKTDDTVPWILWGESVRSNFALPNPITSPQSLSTFAAFAHLDVDDELNTHVLKQCYEAEHKRK
ncbi:MAG: hypothetical protein ACKVOR_00690 [Flavobacteriales bacterium]